MQWPKLLATADERTFERWRQRMLTRFEASRVVYLVLPEKKKGKETEKEKEQEAIDDANARLLLYSQMDEDLEDELRGCKSARAIWEYLGSRFKVEENEQVQRRKLEEYMKRQFEPDYSKTDAGLADYIRAHNRLAAETGFDWTEKKRVAQLLCSMPKEFGAVVAMLNGSESKGLEVERRLVKEAQRLAEEYQRTGGEGRSGAAVRRAYSVAAGCFICGKDGHKAAACSERTGAGTSSNAGAGAGRQQAVTGVCHQCGQRGHYKAECKSLLPACYACGKQGHKKADCPAVRRGGDGNRAVVRKCYVCGQEGHMAVACEKRGQARAVVDSDKCAFAAVAAESQREFPEVIWYDSCASYSLVGSRGDLQDVEKLPQPKWIGVAKKGQGIKLVARGVLKVECEGAEALLSTVAFVAEGLDVPLLSRGCLLNEGLEVESAEFGKVEWLRDRGSGVTRLCAHQNLADVMVCRVRVVRASDVQVAEVGVPGSSRTYAEAVRVGEKGRGRAPASKKHVPLIISPPPGEPAKQGNGKSKEEEIVQGSSGWQVAPAMTKGRRGAGLRGQPVVVEKSKFAVLEEEKEEEESARVAVVSGGGRAERAQRGALKRQQLRKNAGVASGVAVGSAVSAVASTAESVVSAVVPVKDAAVLVGSKAERREVHQARVVHARLGHASSSVLQELVREQPSEARELGLTVRGVKGMGVCDACAEGKQRMSAFLSEEVARPADEHELNATWSCDVFGPFEPGGVQGEKYALVLVESYSRLVVVYAYHAKDEARTVLSKHVSWSERQSGKKMKVLCSDGAGEFVSHNLREELERLGIEKRESPPYTPQQNGKAERKGGVVGDMARTMLLASKMSKTFWVQAWQTAAFVLNRLPSKVPGMGRKTPIFRERQR